MSLHERPKGGKQTPWTWAFLVICSCLKNGVQVHGLKRLHSIFLLETSAMLKWIQICLPSFTKFQCPETWVHLRTFWELLRGFLKGVMGTEVWVEKTLHGRDLMMSWDLCGTWPLSQVMLKWRWSSLYYMNGFSEKCMHHENTFKDFFPILMENIHTTYIMIHNEYSTSISLLFSSASLSCIPRYRP